MGRSDKQRSRGIDKATPIEPNAVSPQHARFIETARTLECDEDETAFMEKLKTIVSHKPAPKPTQAEPSKKPRSKA